MSYLIKTFPSSIEAQLACDFLTQNQIPCFLSPPQEHDLYSKFSQSQLYIKNEADKEKALRLLQSVDSGDFQVNSDSPEKNKLCPFCQQEGGQPKNKLSFWENMKLFFSPATHIFWICSKCSKSWISSP